jgi:ABC-2 type transport system ATP-binding protein
MNGIEIKNISKNFKETKALNDVSISFEQDKIYGLLGRNGAGKSTLLNIITNRLNADSGEVLIDGMPSWENSDAQRKIYMMSEKVLYPENMSGEAALKWSREFYPDFDMDYARKLAKDFGLDLKKKVRSLSTGYASIYKIIIALSVNTPYVFFDEPVLGLDANHRELFYKRLIEKYSENPFTVVLSTHLIEEIASIIEEIIIIQNGEIIQNDSCEHLLSKGYTVSGSASEVDKFIEGMEVIGIDTLGGLKSATIMGKIEASSVPSGIEIGKLDLQKLFIKLTNEQE